MAPNPVTKWASKSIEKVKEVTPGLQEDGPGWRSTSNERNNSMLKEARTYSWALMALHRDLISWDKHTKQSLTSIANLLHASLPRVFDEAHSGAAFPATREHKVVAGDVPTEVLNGASALLHEKMLADVLQPLEQWIEAYKKIKSDNDRVEELRKELDTQRRTHAQTQYKVDKLAAKVGSPREMSPRETEDNKAEKAYEAAADKLETTAAKLERREDQTARLMQRYAEAELHVYNSVCALIQDVTVLRDYCGAAITLMQKTFSTSLRAFQDGPAAAAEEYTLSWHRGLGSNPTRPIPVRSPLQASRPTSTVVSRAPSTTNAPPLLSPTSYASPVTNPASPPITHYVTSPGTLYSPMGTAVLPTTSSVSPVIHTTTSPTAAI